MKQGLRGRWLIGNFEFFWMGVLNQCGLKAQEGLWTDASRGFLGLCSKAEGCFRSPFATICLSKRLRLTVGSDGWRNAAEEGSTEWWISRLGIQMFTMLGPGECCECYTYCVSGQSNGRSKGPLHSIHLRIRRGAVNQHLFGWPSDLEHLTTKATSWAFHWHRFATSILSAFVFCFLDNKCEPPIHLSSSILRHLQHRLGSKLCRTTVIWLSLMSSKVHS